MALASDPAVIVSTPDAAPRGARADIVACICTRDRSVLVRRALRSLMTQSRRPRAVLVVDNAPRDGSTKALVLEEFPDVQYVVEPVAGLDFARNRALREAEAEVLAFLDDDAVADPEWIAATERSFEQGDQIVICTGRVDALFLETAGQRLFEANGGFGRGDTPVRLPMDARRRRLHGFPAPLVAWSISVGSGCSFAVRRRVILALGGFDEALDMGPDLPGGGDLDMLWRTLSAGYEVVYEPRVRARHEHRKEQATAIEQILDHNRSLIAVLTKAATAARGRHRLEVLAFLVWRLVKPLVRMARRLVGRDPLPLPALARLAWASWRGLGTYPAMVRLARKRRAAS